jgi:hypothetical protein
MHVLRVTGDLVTAMLMLLTSTGWPPVAAGAFWVLIGLWGIISVFFDDETPRGIPGLDLIHPGLFSAKKETDRNRT